MLAKRNDKIFHYSLPMEITEWEFYGMKKGSYGMASAFSDHRYFKKRSRLLLKKLQLRINEIVTNDEIFKLMLLNDLEALDKEFKYISPSRHNEIDIMGYFFRLLAHLLGWAHLDGNFYRTPIYFQTKQQQDTDLRKSSKLKIQTGLYECYKKRKLIMKLLAEGDSYATIASIMGMSAANVKGLEKNEHIDNWYKSEFEKEMK
jgi:hypothetical protein